MPTITFENIRQKYDTSLSGIEIICNENAEICVLEDCDYDSSWPTRFGAYILDGLNTSSSFFFDTKEELDEAVKQFKQQFNVVMH